MRKDKNEESNSIIGTSSNELTIITIDTEQVVNECPVTDSDDKNVIDHNGDESDPIKSNNVMYEIVLGASHEIPSTFDDDPPLQVLTTDRVYGKDDEANFEVEVLDVVNKASGKHISFHVVTMKRNHPGVVCVITKRLPNGETGILLGQHWRPSTGKWAWELPRGMGDLNESLEDTAIREAMEETGISIPRSDVKLLQSIQADTGVLSNSIGVVTLEASEDSSAVQEHDWELSHMDWWTMNEIKHAIHEGLITCGITLSALMIYDIHQ